MLAIVDQPPSQLKKAHPSLVGKPTAIRDHAFKEHLSQWAPRSASKPRNSLRSAINNAAWGDVEGYIKSLEAALIIAQRMTMSDVQYWQDHIESTFDSDEFGSARWQVHELGSEARLAHIGQLIHDVGLMYGVDSEGTVSTEIEAPARLLRVLFEDINGDPPALSGSTNGAALAEDPSLQRPGRVLALGAAMRHAERRGIIAAPDEVVEALDAVSESAEEVDACFDLLVSNEGHTLDQLNLDTVRGQWLEDLRRRDLVEDTGTTLQVTTKGWRMLRLMSEYASNRYTWRSLISKTPGDAA